jgi:hypothetical protein
LIRNEGKIARGKLQGELFLKKEFPLHPFRKTLKTGINAVA